ncbi:MAG: hypothetical protein IJO91_03585 [Oscillospiraceae bacterium]|nr:hypothetical protein [Oscillospiraceae bacterium]
MEWTAPKWCKQGDIVFFMHSKTSFATIRRLYHQLLREKSLYTNGKFQRILGALQRGEELYSKYGGKIFAIALVSGELQYDCADIQIYQHWKSQIYVPIDKIYIFEHPIDISQFRSVITISNQSSITPVFGNEFKFLKSLIVEKEEQVPSYLLDAEAEIVPLSKINDNNWLSILNKHRRSFFLEIQFRTFYVDRLLSMLGDNKTFFRECVCFKHGFSASYVDNVIKFNGNYLPVEVKLSVKVERDLVGQVSRYCNLQSLALSKNKIINSNIYSNYILIIDTDNVYLYNDNNKEIELIMDLDELQLVEDILKLRNIISMKIN